jgi:alkylation response protein AidB-like acyl-CoA dehydrogenase
MSDVRDQDTLDLLADVARDFATADLDRVRRVRDRGGAVDRAMWMSIAANGWLGISVPEGLGGAGLGIEAVALVARRLGYASFPEPFVAAGVLAGLVLAGAGDSARDRLQGMMDGSILVALAWQPPAGGQASDGTTLVASSAGEEPVVLTGETRFARPADADAFLVAARDRAGIGLYWVPREADGVVIESERCADGTTSGWLTFNDVRVAAEDHLVPSSAGESVLAAALDAARVVSSAELTGLMDRAIELTLDYLRARKQFGRPIGSFQALQHRATNIWMQRELTTAALEAAINVMEDDASTPRQRAAAASSVKARAASAAPAVCGEALQMHGAIGFTDEYHLSLLINRALTLVPWLGGATEHRRRYARLIRDAGDLRP